MIEMKREISPRKMQEDLKAHCQPCPYLFRLILSFLNLRMPKSILLEFAVIIIIEGAHKLQIEYNISMLQSHCSMRIL